MALKALLARSTKIPLWWVLVIPFVLQTVGAVGLVGYLSYRSGQQAVEELVSQLMTETSHRIVQNLNHYFGATRTLVREQQSIIQLGAFDWQSRALMETHFAKQLVLHTEVSGLMIATETKEFLAVGRASPKHLAIRIRNPATGAIESYAADGQGNRLYRRDVFPNYDPHQSPPNNPWYQAAIAHPDGLWRLLVSPVRGQEYPVLMMAYFLPFTDAQRTRQGVLSASVHLDQLGGFLRQLQISRTGQAFIMDDQGLLIATSTGEPPFRQDLATPLTTELFAPEKRRLAAQASANPVIRDAARWSLNQQTRASDASTPVRVRLHHQPYFGYRFPFQLDDNTRWTVVMVVPEADFMGEIYRTLWRTILMCALTLLGATATGILTAYWIAKPIERLSRVSQALAQGNWQQSLNEDSSISELSLLAKSFNLTAAQLQQSFDRITTTLHESEEKFTKVFRTSPDPIYITTVGDGGQFLEVNDSFLQLSEYSREEVVGRTAADLNFSANAAQDVALVDALAIAGKVSGFEYHYRTRSGRIGTTLLSCELIELDGLQWCVTVAKDISDRKQLEQALQQALQQLDTHFQESPLAIVQWDRDFRVLRWSKQAEVIFGWTAAEVKNLSWQEWDFIDVDDRDRVNAELAPLMNGWVTGKAIQNRNYTKDGRVILCQWYSSAVFDDTGNLVSILSFGEDITAFKEAQTALQHQKELRETIYNESTDALFLVDPTTLLITDCNRRAVELFEATSKDDLIGIEGRMLQRRPFTATERQDITLEIEAKGFWSMEVEYVTRSGNHFWGSIAVKPVQIAGQAVNLVRVTDISEVKLAAAALRESEERFRLIAATLDQLFFVRCAQTGQFLYISPAYEKIWGRSCASLYDDPESWLAAVHPDDRPHILDSLTHQLQGQSVQREYRIIQLDGTIRWVTAQISPAFNQVGQLVRHVGFAADISDRKQTEEALRYSEARFQKVTTAVPGEIYTLVLHIDGTFSVEYISPACREIHELEPEQIMADASLTFSLVHPDDLSALMRAAADSARDIVPFRHEWRIVTASGKQKWVQATSRPERRDNGDVVWYGVLQDISDRKQAESSLRESEERFRQAFDAAPIGMALVSLEGQFLRVNRNLCEMLGYSEADLLERTFQMITYPDDLAANLTNLQKLLNGEQQSYQMEKRYIHQQGWLIWALLAVSTVKDATDAPQYFVAQVQDISDRYKIDRMKDEFISIVSHELRTPLTAIRGSLGILETGVFDHRPNEAKHMLHVALNNSERLVRLVNDILDLERMESGKVQLVMETCQVSELLSHAVGAVQAIALNAAVSLAVNPVSVEIWAAPDAIVQTLTNLLSNAIKFSAAGSTVWLSASVVNEEWAGGNGKARSTTAVSRLCSPHVLFTVKDQGRGIPTDKLESIFGRFQQVDVSDSRQKGGTGLGLAICRSIVLQHHGQIWAESTLGEGSTFYFAIPAERP